MPVIIQARFRPNTGLTFRSPGSFDSRWPEQAPVLLLNNSWRKTRVRSLKDAGDISELGGDASEADERVSQKPVTPCDAFLTASPLVFSAGVAGEAGNCDMFYINTLP